MSICFKLGTAEWYCVTEGKIFAFILGLGWRACFLYILKHHFQESSLDKICVY